MIATVRRRMAGSQSRREEHGWCAVGLRDRWLDHFPSNRSGGEGLRQGAMRAPEGRIEK